VAFPDDSYAIRVNGDADPGDIDREVCAAVLAGKDATGFDRFPVPTIKPEDPL
jgi:hypothetical protein